MNEKYERIEEFLYLFRDIVKENHGYSLYYDSVYYILTNLGVKEKKSINDNFNKWISYFRTDVRINVFVRENWTYFCQFISNDKKAQMADEHLKVYIPLDAEHIEKGATEIFNFLSSEGISHSSKIGSRVRMDDIVIRLINPTDIDKLAQFVNNNQYIQEGLIKPNPFCFNHEGLAMAVDGDTSFNSVVAMMIKLYINSCSKNNNLDKVSVNDFMLFVNNYYQNSFSSKKGLNKFTKDFKRLEKCGFEPEIIVNYQNVLKLFIKSMNNNFSYKDYLLHYKECSDKSLQSVKVRQILKVLNGEVDKNDNYIDTEKKVIIDIQNILLIMENKYGRQSSMAGLENYIRTGDSSYLTREEGLRKRIALSTFRGDVLGILNKRNVDIYNYLNIVSQIVVGMNEVYLDKAIIETYEKYKRLYQEGESRTNGHDFVTMALHQFIINGVYYGFTRENGARKNLENNVSVDAAKRIIMKKMGIKTENELLQHNIDNLIEQYINGVINNHQSKSR